MKPQLFNGIVLHVLGDSGLQKYALKPLSHQNFIKFVESVGAGAGVIPLAEFDPNATPELTVPSAVELDDNAEYVVVVISTRNFAEGIKSLEGWKKNRTDGSERQLGEALRRHAVRLGHTNVDVRYNMKVVGPAGKPRQLDAVAFAGGCVFVGEYKNKMDSEGFEQLGCAVDWIEANKNLGEGNVTEFKDKQIFGVLAGCVETSDTKDKIEMDRWVKKRGFLKWFEGLDFGPESNSPSQAPALSCVPKNTDAPQVSPGNGTATTTPAAMPRRVRQVAFFPVRRAQVPFHSRSLPKFFGSRL